HASIVSIDTARAKSARGVEAILLASDIGEGLGSSPSNRPVPLHRPDGSPMFEPKRLVLASDRTRFVGHPIAMVVATSEAAAHDAAELIDIDFKELPAIVSVLDAIKEGAPPVWAQCPDNASYL